MTEAGAMIVKMYQTLLVRIDDKFGAELIQYEQQLTVKKRILDIGGGRADKVEVYVL